MRIRLEQPWILGIVGAEVLIWYCNGSPAWIGGNAGIMNVLATFVYIAFWIFFVGFSGKRRWMIATALIAAMFHFVSSISALMASSNAPLISTIGYCGQFFTIFHAGVTFYGLRAWLNWEETYAVGVVLSVLWAIWSWFLWKRKKK